MISLPLSQNESFFLAWCQAHTIAVMKNDIEAAKVAYDFAVHYAAELGVEGVDTLAEKHNKLVIEAWPGLKFYDKKTNGGVSQ